MYILFNVLFEFVVFQNILLQYIEGFSYIDEIITLVLISLLVLEILRQKLKFTINKNDKKVILFFSIYLSIGILSSIIYRIQPQTIAVYKDILATCKIFICYISVVLLTKNMDKEKLSKKISKRARIYIIILFIGAIINLLIETSMTASIRYGLRSYKFLFGHETYLVSSLVLLISVIEANKQKDDDKIILLGLISIALSFRTKGFLFVISYIFIRILNKYNFRIKMSHIMIMLLVGFILFNEKIVDTYSYGLSAARPALHIVGIYLLIEYFPLGSGFGTFASTLSGEYYSPIYNKYHIDTVSGLTKLSYNYMGDSFWPYIYGQTGVFGLLSYISMLIYIFKATKERCIQKNRIFLPAFLIIIYLFISSTSEAVFIDVTGPMSIIILCGYLGV